MIDTLVRLSDNKIYPLGLLGKREKVAQNGVSSIQGHGRRF